LSWPPCGKPPNATFNRKKAGKMLCNPHPVGTKAAHYTLKAQSLGKPQATRPKCGFTAKKPVFFATPAKKSRKKRVFCVFRLADTGLLLYIYATLGSASFYLLLLKVFLTTAS
jgi:hypothetical protein